MNEQHSRRHGAPTAHDSHTPKMASGGQGGDIQKLDTASNVLLGTTARGALGQTDPKKISGPHLYADIGSHDLGSNGDSKARDMKHVDEGNGTRELISRRGLNINDMGTVEPFIAAMNLGQFGASTVHFGA